MSNKRRAGSLALIVAGLGIAAWLVVDHRERDPELSRPIPRVPGHSLLLVTVDTTRADHLEPYGAQQVETPTLMALAERGIVFEQAFSVAPITLVAHTSILTGLYPPQHGVRNNGIHHAPDELETLAERLASQGYRTAAFVSASVLERRYGLDQGFEQFDDDLSTGRERHPRMVPDRPAEATVAAASAWLDTLAEEESFFLWVHFYDPHASYSPPPPWRDRYRSRLYDGEIAYMDDQLGRLLEHRRLRREQRVVVAVVGDHGESFGEHGEQTHALLPYDATLRIPWILAWPEAPSGTRFPFEVDQTDVLPTLLDLLGLEPPAEVAGESVLAVLEGAPYVPRGRYAETYLPFYTYGWSKLKVLRRGGWKLIDAPAPELYELGRDPYELSNQYEQQPGLAHDLRRDLGELLEALGDPERETALALDSQAAEKLRALGYLSVGSRGAEPRESRPDPKEVVDLHVNLEQARRLARDRLFDGAVLKLDEVLERDPGNLAALVDLAGVLRDKGDVDEAIRTVERALALDPNYARLHILLGGLEARRGNLEQALELFEVGLELDPRSTEARIQRATVLRRLQRGEEALAELELGLEQYPEDPRLQAVYAQMGEIGRGDLEAGERRLREALARDPFLVLGWRLLGDVLERTDRPDEALAAYGEGLERQPDDPELHARIGLLLARQGAGTETEIHLREAIRLSRIFRSELHVALGAWLAERGRLEEADEEYERVLAIEPRNVQARNNRAIAHYRTGRIEEARRELEALVAERPRHADAHNNLAAIAVEQERWSEAEASARLALGLDGSLVEAWNNLGLAREQQGDLEEASRDYEHALEIAPGYWIARFNLGVLLGKQERFQEALVAFEEVVLQVPGYPGVHLELGRLYAGPLGDPALARSHLNAFLRAAPNHAEASGVRRLLEDLSAPG